MTCCKIIVNMKALQGFIKKQKAHFKLI
jgi:hypothetical protein